MGSVTRKWTVRSYYPDGERVEEFDTEAKAWAAAKRHLANRVAAAVSGHRDDDDPRNNVAEVGMVVDDPDKLDVMFTKWGGKAP